MSVLLSGRYPVAYRVDTAGDLITQGSVGLCPAGHTAGQFISRRASLPGDRTVSLSNVFGEEWCGVLALPWNESA